MVSACGICTPRVTALSHHGDAAKSSDCNDLRAAGGQVSPGVDTWLTQASGVVRSCHVVSVGAGHAGSAGRPRVRCAMHPAWADVNRLESIMQIMFHRPTPIVTDPTDKAKRKPKGTQVARADITGVLPTPLDCLVIRDFGLALMPDRTVAVYMPGSRWNHVISAGRIALSAPIVVDGRSITHEDDPNGVTAVGLLEDAIRNAWADATATGAPYEVAREFAL